MNAVLRSLFCCLIVVSAEAATSGTQAAGEDRVALFFHCSADNDLYQAVRVDGIGLPRFESTEEAIDAAGEGDAVLVLADDYPQKTTPIDPDLFREAARKKLRLYVEFPAALPSLDGGWFRAFDFRRWEPRGSNADVGWGAWAIESGWTQGWIVSVLAMRQMKTSLWDLTQQSGVEEHFDRLRRQMLPDGGLVNPQPVGAPK